MSDRSNVNLSFITTFIHRICGRKELLQVAAPAASMDVADAADSQQTAAAILSLQQQLDLPSLPSHLSHRPVIPSSLPRPSATSSTRRTQQQQQSQLVQQFRPADATHGQRQQQQRHRRLSSPIVRPEKTASEGRKRTSAAVGGADDTNGCHTVCVHPIAGHCPGTRTCVRHQDSSSSINNVRSIGSSIVSPAFPQPVVLLTGSVHCLVLNRREAELCVRTNEVTAEGSQEEEDNGRTVGTGHRAGQARPSVRGLRPSGPQ